jgi:hypothetical protein
MEDDIDILRVDRVYNPVLWLQFAVSIAIRCTLATNTAVPRFINVRIMSFPINVFETLISHFRYV